MFSTTINRINGKRRRVTSSTIMKVLQIISHQDSVGSGFYCLRLPNHRRYENFLYPFLGRDVNSLVKYPLGFAFTFVMMVNNKQTLSDNIYVNLVSQKFADPSLECSPVLFVYSSCLLRNGYIMDARCAVSLVKKKLSLGEGVYIKLMLF